MNNPNDGAADTAKLEDEGLSPMDAPEAKSPPAGVHPVPREELAPFLQILWDEHEALTVELDKFEAILASIREEGINPISGGRLSDFFQHYDEEVLAHHKKEERHLFPILEEKLIAAGEHSTGPEMETPVSMMEDEHLKSVQTAAVMFNLLGMASRLPDEESKKVVLETALKQGDEFLELMRLHIFRENNIIFPMAHELIDAETLQAMGAATEGAPQEAQSDGR